MTITNNPHVVLDENVLVNLPNFGDCIVRQPDFIDEVFGTAVWIGEDAAVEVPLTEVFHAAQFARQYGLYARSGMTPEQMNVSVILHDENFVHPSFCMVRDPQQAHLNTQWREIADVLDATEVSA